MEGDLRKAADKLIEAEQATIEIEALKFEVADIKTKINELHHLLTVRRPEAPQKQFIPPPPPQQPSIMQTPLNQPDNAFTAIKNFAEAMGALRGYENKVVDGYRQLRSELKEEVSGEDFEEAPASTEDYFLKIAAEKLLGGSQKTQQSPLPNAESSQNREEYIVGSGNSSYSPYPQQPQKQPENFDYKHAAAQVPEYIKKGIRSGEINLSQATEIALKEAKKLNVSVSKENIEKLYAEIKNTKK